MWMTEKEIVERYVRGIDDKYTMCKILSELNRVSFDRIKKILNAAGYEVPKSRTKYHHAD